MVINGNKRYLKRLLVKALFFNDRKRKKTLCWPVLNRGKKNSYRLSRWRTKVQRQGKGKEIVDIDNVNKYYYQKVNIECIEKQKSYLKSFKPKLKTKI